MNNLASRKLQLAALCSFALWILIFSAGLLINSAPYRSEMKRDGKALQNFIPAAILYTPINVAILCALAGFIGGCASNLATENGMLKTLSEDEGAFAPGELAKIKTRLQYMEENPFLSMLRGFVVYLTFLAGILIAVDDPFGTGSEAKYLRYAGILSLVAFGMGYDPSRFEQLLESIPQMGGKRKDDANEATATVTKTAQVKVELKQGFPSVGGSGGEGEVEGKPAPTPGPGAKPRK